jgi:hypothetical protein
MYDPSINAMLGLYYLNSLYRSYNGDTHRTLTVYDRGVGRMKKWTREHATSVTLCMIPNKGGDLFGHEYEREYHLIRDNILKAFNVLKED